MILLYIYKQLYYMIHYYIAVIIHSHRIHQLNVFIKFYCQQDGVLHRDQPKGWSPFLTSPKMLQLVGNISIGFVWKSVSIGFSIQPHGFFHSMSVFQCFFPSNPMGFSINPHASEPHFPMNTFCLGGHQGTGHMKLTPKGEGLDSQDRQVSDMDWPVWHLNKKI